MNGTSTSLSKKIHMLFFVFLTLATIGGANAQTDASSDIVTNVEQRIGTKLPKGYAEKIRNFMINNKTLKKEIAAKFTEDFIVNEMQSDRGTRISRENKLLFIYCAIGYNYNQDFYTGDDGDNNRMSEFEEVMDTIENCQARYKNEFISYMQQRSADAQQRSADAQQRSADAQQRSADAQQRSADAQQSILKSLNKSLDAIIEFYKLYDISPDPDRLRTFKKDVQELITRCKQDGIDYKFIILEKVGDMKKVDAILKFYGVE